MWRRRVGVTAGSRRVARESWLSCRPQLRWQHPSALRTPMGTRGAGRDRSADGSMATVALESVGRRRKEYRLGADSALNARMRRCLILRQGARPLRPPAPFPFFFMFRKGGNLSRVRKPRPNTGHALHKFPPFRRVHQDKGKGACVGWGRHRPPVGRPRDFREWSGTKKSLDIGRPSHGSHDRKGVFAFPPHGSFAHA